MRKGETMGIKTHRYSLPPLHAAALGARPRRRALVPAAFRIGAGASCHARNKHTSNALNGRREPPKGRLTVRANASMSTIMEFSRTHVMTTCMTRMIFAGTSASTRAESTAALR